MKFFLAQISEAQDAITSLGIWKFGLLGIIWGAFQQNFPGYWGSDPVLYMNFIWSGNFILGSMAALGHTFSEKGDPEKKWSIEKAFGGISKWIAYSIALMITYQMRNGHGIYLETFAYLIEIAIGVVETTRLIRNFGTVTKNEKITNKFANSMDKGSEIISDAIALKLEQAFDRFSPNGNHGSNISINGSGNTNTINLPVQETDTHGKEE